MPNTTLTSPAKVASAATYARLLASVRSAISLGKARAQDAVEREKVRTSWEIGKLILDHILLNKERADYGAQVLKRLSGDLGISKTELGYMLQFARAYPIAPTSGQLSWGKYRDLLAVNDADQRVQLEKKAVQNNWSVQEIRREIKKQKSATQMAVTKLPKSALTQPVFGKIGVYRVVRYHEINYYDLGFSVHLEIKGKTPKTKNPDEKDLYFYNARVFKVYDGDTFHAFIDLGFGVALTERLRLRRLNAPELPSADGEKARKILEKILMKNGGSIQIRTSKADDQYGRYLVDVWLDCTECPNSGSQYSRHKARVVNIEQKLLQSGLLTVRGGE